MHHHKWVSAQLWGASLHPGNTPTHHKSALRRRAGRWGPQPFSYLVPYLPFQGRPCGLVTPLEMLLNPQSSIFNSPLWHCASGWQSLPGQGNPAEMRLWCVCVWWGAAGRGVCSARRAHGSLLLRVPHVSSWALSFCVPSGSSQNTPHPTVSQRLQQDSVWPRCTAMRCYIQAFGSLGRRGGWVPWVRR